MRALLVATACATFLCSTTPAADAENEIPLNWWIGAYGVDKLHEEGFDGAGQTIVISEGGLYPDSPDLVGADVEYLPLSEECQEVIPLDPEDEIEQSLHGTNVANMIVGQGGPDNIQGVAPRAKLIVVQVRNTDNADPDDPRTPSCIEEAHSVVRKVIDRNPTVYSNSVDDGDLPKYAPYLLLTGHLAFDAVGNNGTEAPNDPEELETPTPGMVSIGAVDPEGNVADFSSRQHDLALLAPGAAVLGRDIDGNLTEINGTSFASPYAAGVFALAKQRWPQATDLQLAQSMLRTAIGAEGEIRHDSATGSGLIAPYAFVHNDPTGLPDVPPFLPASNAANVNASGDKYLPFYDVLDGTRDCSGLPLCEDGQLRAPRAHWLPPLVPAQTTAEGAGAGQADVATTGSSDDVTSASPNRPHFSPRAGLALVGLAIVALITSFGVRRHR
ncbi:S8 family peptidase [Corynebacterium epidermidicanis]|uniref:Subtilase family protease n=1 Tax=Corynebacterium epidermidicanis TaxID=1050174 RepID=A0A0G3GZM9_9CORY|nr:S8/S53 family peptidase [Corynebacterium epidermidicanis]AKK04277.1 subtilase family protease [Corynebacterium epidermidicanis]